MPAPLLLSTSAAFWALNFYLAIFMMQSASPIESAFFRYLCAMVIMSVLLLRGLPNWALIQTNLKGFLLAGGIGLFGFNLFFFLALQHTTAINASLIGATNPAVTFILAWMILKQPIKPIHWLGILLSFAGVLYLLTKGDISQIFQIQLNLGDIFMMGSNIAFGLYHIYVSRFAKNISNLHFTYFTNLICFLGFALMLSFYPIGKVQTYPSIFWYSMLGMGALGTVIAYLLWNIGIAKVGSANASLYLNLITAFVALLGWFFGETLYAYHIWSLVIIVSGILVIQLYSRVSMARAR